MIATTWTKRRSAAIATLAFAAALLGGCDSDVQSESEG